MRKSPQQERSQFLVNSLVDAAAATIAEEGLAAATSSRIAARAGVSVGSLYQYFESKEDLYAKVLERLARELFNTMQRQIERLPEVTIDDFVRGLLTDVWALLEADKQRYLQISRYWTQLDFAATLNALELQLTMALAVAVASRGSASPASELSARVYVLVNSLLFTTLRTISHPAAHVTREQIIETFASMAKHLLAGVSPGVRGP